MTWQPIETAKEDETMTDLTREDMMEAVSEGVRRAIAGSGMFVAIRDGVAAGIWRVATNATDAPTADFFDSVKEGVRDGVSRMSLPD